VRLSVGSIQTRSTAADTSGGNASREPRRGGHGLAGAPLAPVASVSRAVTAARSTRHLNWELWFTRSSPRSVSLCPGVAVFVRRRLRQTSKPAVRVGAWRLRRLRNSLVALQVRVGDTRERRQNGDEHQREKNRSLHVDLPPFSRPYDDGRSRGIQGTRMKKSSFARGRIEAVSIAI